MHALTTSEFQAIVYDFYAQNGRHDLPWRVPEPVHQLFDPYKIMVSELMLQQTQVVRVIPKFLAFIEHFPSQDALATATLADVLRLWSGLGYNRRAKFLHTATQMIVTDLGGIFPNELEALIRLPGIGHNTAGAIMAYAFNKPVVFIETNIRTVYLYHYFSGERNVSDRQIREVVVQTLDYDAPRQWYWALMDYGSHIKRTVGNVSMASTSYTKQAPFNGSRRQLRGAIIRGLSSQPQSYETMSFQLHDERLAGVLEQLLEEGLIHRTDDQYHL